jgi:enamine deaminase RidA (YjgF/YER057c/UK114 family)
MSIETLQPAEWLRPKGYANGMCARGKLIFISGQIGWDGQGQFTSDTLAGQVRQTLQNIVRVLKEGNAEPRHLVRLTWYVLSREAYYCEATGIGAAYREILGKHFPAMSVVQVGALMEERALVEIEATAVVPDE